MWDGSGIGVWIDLRNYIVLLFILFNAILPEIASHFKT